MSVLIKPPEFDHYLVTRVLGEGGMGIVFLGDDRRTGLPVAIKVMSRAAQNPELTARFLQENQILSSLNHRNIVRCYEVTRSREGLPSLVMEYLSGAEFGAFEGRPYPELIPLMVQAAMGLGYLKERSILHRDLSPNNILVTIVNDRRLVKILDFGVAKVLQEGSGSELTQTGEFLGKLAYASPELLTLSAVDFRSDIFSLGIIYFRLLTTRRPIPVQNTRNYLEWVRAHEDRKPLDWEVFPPARPVPPKLRDLVARMLAKEPSDRPQGYDEIVDTLVAVQSDAEREGIVPDPATLASLPDQKPGPGASSGSAGSPAGSSPSSAERPAPGTGASRPQISASSFFDDKKFSFGEEKTAAKEDPFSAETSAGPVQGAAGAAPPPAAAASQPDWLERVDYMEEMQAVSAGRPAGRPTQHPMRVVDDRPRMSSTGPVRRETHPIRQPEAKAGGSSGLAVAGVIAAVVLGGGGYAGWKIFLAAPPDENSPVVRPAAPAFDAPRATVPTPLTRRGSATTGAAATAEGRRLVTENVEGFLVSPSRGHTIASAAAILVGFKRPVNVSGLSAATLVEARDASGSPIAELEGIDAEVVPPDDPTGSMRVKFLIKGDLEPGDPRVGSLRTVVLRVGPATFKAKLDKGLLSH